MNRRSRMEVTVAALVVLVGLLMGGMLAMLHRSSTAQVDRGAATTVSVARSPRPATAPPASAPSQRPTPTPTLPPTAAPAPARTVATPIPTPPPSTPAPAPAPTATAAPAVASGTTRAWRIDEANVQVGTIVWSGGPVASGDGSVVLAVHKESIAGRPASPCERQTVLRAVIAVGRAAQTVPYRETNCAGATSAGEMRIANASPDGTSFSGAFWRNGALLGNFTATGTRGAR